MSRSSERCCCRQWWHSCSCNDITHRPALLCPSCFLYLFFFAKSTCIHQQMIHHFGASCQIWRQLDLSPTMRWREADWKNRKQGGTTVMAEAVWAFSCCLGNLALRSKWWTNNYTNKNSACRQVWGQCFHEAVCFLSSVGKQIPAIRTWIESDDCKTNNEKVKK